MTVHNTSLRPSVFFLVGIPGLESVQHWIAVPLCSMYALALLGNCIILLVIWTEPSLHKPMYLFLAMLAITDLVLSTSTLPKMLGIFWLGAREIGFHACLTQMFFIHVSSTVESGILTAMAYDRYVAICNPLRHAEILRITVVAKIGLMVFVRGLLIITPFPFLLWRLSFCQATIIPHSYCEQMAIVMLACTDTTISRLYGLIMALLVVALDGTSITLSYGMILQAAFALPSNEARLKALSTCGSHICVLLVFYIPGLFSFLADRFGQNVPHHIHVILASLYLLLPPMLNPIVYGVKTKQIREKVTRVLCWRRD